MAIQIQFRRDIAANWTSANPTLLAGEPGYETDTGRFKVGDGTTAWTGLVYYGANGFVYGNNIEIFTTGTGASWTVPTQLRYTAGTSYNAQPGRWKVTQIGGGGSGGGTVATAGHVGNGGGSGGGIVTFYSYVTGQNSMTYTVGGGGAAQAAGAAGVAGTATSTTYNGVTNTAGQGGGGATSATVNGGGTATANTIGNATLNTLNLAGRTGDTGGVNTALIAYMGYGGQPPLATGSGFLSQGTAAGGAGIAATGFGAGGAGARNGSSATSFAGAAGGGGILIIEY